MCGALGGVSGARLAQPAGRVRELRGVARGATRREAFDQRGLGHAQPHQHGLRAGPGKAVAEFSPGVRIAALARERRGNHDVDAGLRGSPRGVHERPVDRVPHAAARVPGEQRNDGGEGDVDSIERRPQLAGDDAATVDLPDPGGPATTTTIWLRISVMAISSSGEGEGVAASALPWLHPASSSPCRCTS